MTIHTPRPLTSPPIKTEMLMTMANPVRSVGVQNPGVRCPTSTP
jgi:hypothetical protein